MSILERLSSSWVYSFWEMMRFALISWFESGVAEESAWWTKPIDHPISSPINHPLPFTASSPATRSSVHLHTTPPPRDVILGPLTQLPNPSNQVLTLYLILCAWSTPQILFIAQHLKVKHLSHLKRTSGKKTSRYVRVAYFLNKHAS